MNKDILDKEMRAELIKLYTDNFVCVATLLLLNRFVQSQKEPAEKIVDLLVLGWQEQNKAFALNDYSEDSDLHLSVIDEVGNSLKVLLLETGDVF
jgi:hypothetical protein